MKYKCKEITNTKKDKERGIIMKKAVIVSAVRTPVGSYGGVYKNFNAVQLGVVAVKEALKRAKVSPEQEEELLIGKVLQAG